MRIVSKEESRRRWAELRDLVIAWDPAGLSGEGFPQDEYDDIVGWTMRLLEGGASPRDLAIGLEREISTGYGTSVSGATEFAKRASAWFATRWRGTTAG